MFRSLRPLTGNDWSLAMKKPTVVSLALTIVVITSAGTPAQETLPGGLEERGGYGGISFRHLSIQGGFGLLSGGQGAIVLGRRVAIGGGVWGLLSKNRVTDALGNDHRLEFGYGGLLLEFLSDPDRLTHHYFDLIIGWGEMKYRDPFTDRERGKDDFLIIEPGAHLALNVLPFVRVSTGIGYRSIIGFTDTTLGFGLERKDIKGYAVSLTIRFGIY